MNRHESVEAIWANDKGSVKKHPEKDNMRRVHKFSRYASGATNKPEGLFVTETPFYDDSFNMPEDMNITKEQMQMLLMGYEID